MYYIQDAHGFWNWIYFVVLIVVSILQTFILPNVIQRTHDQIKKNREKRNTILVIVVVSAIVIVIVIVVYKIFAFIILDVCRDFVLVYIIIVGVIHSNVSVVVFNVFVSDRRSYRWHYH